TKVQCFSNSLMAFLTGSSSQWPSISTKKKYSQFFLLDGRLSILLMLSFSRLNGSSAEYNAPTRSWTQNMSEVLSSFVGGQVVCDITRNRVVLFGLSCTERSRMRRP